METIEELEQAVIDSPRCPQYKNGYLAAMDDVRTLMAGKRLVEDVPIQCPTCRGAGHFLAWGSKGNVRHNCKTCKSGGSLYASPSDAGQ